MGRDDGVRHSGRIFAVGVRDKRRHMARFRLALYPRVHQREPARRAAPVMVPVAVEHGQWIPTLSLLCRHSCNAPCLFLWCAQRPRTIANPVVQRHVPREVRVSKDVQVRLQFGNALLHKFAPNDLREVRLEQKALLGHQLRARQEVGKCDHRQPALHPRYLHIPDQRLGQRPDAPSLVFLIEPLGQLSGAIRQLAPLACVGVGRQLIGWDRLPLKLLPGRGL
mmetsp:Transcript_72543/g.208226  ORF Transcript_72543/g.208226 Transcript_72543/m.208226 type:complete len:223 (-) Transcript_72543:737-1405(-)